MIEEIVLSYLSDALNVPVYLFVPEHPSKEYVTIERTGGGKVNRISRATFALQSVGNSLIRAAQINEAVKAAMDDIVSLNAVYKSSLNSDYNFTDTNTKYYRYQAVYDLVY